MSCEGSGFPEGESPIALDFITGRFDDQLAESKDNQRNDTTKEPRLYICHPELVEGSLFRRRAARAAAVQAKNACPPAPCRLTAISPLRQPPPRTPPTAPDGTGKRAQARARPTQRLPLVLRPQKTHLLRMADRKMPLRPHQGPFLRMDLARTDPETDSGCR